MRRSRYFSFVVLEIYAHYDYDKEWILLICCSSNIYTWRFFFKYLQVLHHFIWELMEKSNFFLDICLYKLMLSPQFIKHLAVSDMFNLPSSHMTQMMGPTSVIGGLYNKVLPRWTKHLLLWLFFFFFSTVVKDRIQTLKVKDVKFFLTGRRWPGSHYCMRERARETDRQTER